MTYDIHAHSIPAELIDLLRADGHRFGIEVIDTPRGASALIAGRVEAGPLRADLTDVERRVAAMDATGVDLQVLSSWIDLTAYALDPALGRAYARRFNRILADEASRRPDRFLALATVPLQAPEGAAEELRYA
ncbi:MAG: amidohydrolase family protein, partial [Acidimicrobiia bacterium]